MKCDNCDNQATMHKHFGEHYGYTFDWRWEPEFIDDDCYDD